MILVLCTHLQVLSKNVPIALNTTIVQGVQITNMLIHVQAALSVLKGQ